MASKKNYSRYFIILQEDERGYGLAPGKAPTGYAKIEMKNSKCKVSYYVQNLKPASNKYCMLLICGKKGCQKLINIGDIVLDAQGRADLSYEYDVQNIANSNIAADKIIGASICRMVDSNVISLMSGFTTTDIPNDWKLYTVVNVNSNKDEKEKTEKSMKENIFDKYEKQIEGNKKLEKELKVECKKTVEDKEKAKEESKKSKSTEKIEEKKIKIEEKIEEKVKDSRKDKLDNKVKDKIEDKIKDKVEDKIKDKFEDKIKDKIEDKIEDNIEKKIEDKILDKINDKKEKLEHKIECEKEANKESKNKDEKYKVCSNKGYMEEFFENLGEGMEKYWDIFPNIKKSVWYKVDIKDMEDLCDMSDYDKYVVMYYPMINYYKYIKEYKHYLVGYKYGDDCKIKYMMYAIPGSKCSKCQPFSGKTGFVTWMKASDLGENCGYWIMFYDFKNSNILIPMKKNK